jgi:hypothetical protein
MPKHPAKAMHKVSRKADVAADSARLKGMSRADLERDDKRGPSSPLGKRKEKGK